MTGVGSRLRVSRVLVFGFRVQGLGFKGLGLGSGFWVKGRGSNLGWMGESMDGPASGANYLRKLKHTR